MASPDVVMFIRHGEKPSDDGPPHGVNDKGEHDPHSLSVRGWTRAGALAALFAHAPAESQLVVPQRIMATKHNDEYKSKREVDTARPLAQRLGLTIDQDFDHEHVKDLSDAILNDPRPTLVVWHHGSMSNVLEYFPIGNFADVPTQWPEDRFDLIWILHRDPDGVRYRFESLPQDLLDGDRSTVS